MPDTLAPSWLKKARALCEDRLVTDPDLLVPYGRDEYATDEYVSLPLAVVKPADEKEAAAIVSLCCAEKVPLTVRGGGTGLSGGCIPAPGGIVLSMERMNRLIDADRDNLTITVQAGMPLRQLYQEVEQMSLYFPPHPGDEGAHVGGAVAANAGGSRAVKYGTVRRFVQGLQVIMADGQVLDLGGKYVKSSTGYHLLELLAGSEGTLGIITRVTLGLLPPVGSVKTLVAPFPTVLQAITAVPEMLHRGIIPCAVEFIEHSVLRAVERRQGTAWPAREGVASLMIILDGRDEEDTLSQAQTVAASLEASGAMDVLIVEQRQRQAEILALRSGLYETVRAVTAESFDVCVPRSEIAGHVARVHEIEQEFGMPLPTYGHAADGNVHSHLLRTLFVDGEFGAEIPEWRSLRTPVREALYADVVRRGGVISGEHGIGRIRKGYLPMNVTPAHLAVMKAVKRALDPNGILNPGTIFDL
jgi:glycolate oxidase